MLRYITLEAGLLLYQNTKSHFNQTGPVEGFVPDIWLNFHIITKDMWTYEKVKIGRA